MEYDKDIKIAGNKPSQDIVREQEKGIEEIPVSRQEIKNAKELGRLVALKFIEDAGEFSKPGDIDDYEMVMQRRLLLSFTATVGFEQYCKNDTLSGIAQKSFIDTLKKNDNDLFASSSDTGAFSFYYLAFRRGGDIERRMGQTFAMLCSHDGDPVYQELGEALYCWFLSFVNKCVKQLGLDAQKPQT